MELIDNQARIGQVVAAAFEDGFDGTFILLYFARSAQHVIQCSDNYEEIFCIGTDCRFYAERVGIADRRNTANVSQPIEFDSIGLTNGSDCSLSLTQSNLIR